MNDDLVLKTLIAARKLIDTPEKWAQRAEIGPKHCAGLACFTAGGNSDG